MFMMILCQMFFIILIVASTKPSSYYCYQTHSIPPNCYSTISMHPQSSGQSVIPNAISRKLIKNNANQNLSGSVMCNFAPLRIRYREFNKPTNLCQTFNFKRGWQRKRSSSICESECQCRSFLHRRKLTAFKAIVNPLPCDLPSSPA